MKSFYARRLWALVGLVGLAGPLTAAEPFGSASLLPMPSAQQPGPYVPHIAPASYGMEQEEISPSDQAPSSPPPAVSMSPDYKNAMKQSWDKPSCADGACGDACCGRACATFYAYGGALALGRANQCDTAITQYAPGNYNTILSTSQAEQDWSGGFEARLGWVLPNCCNAVEVGYWGIYPDDQTAYVNAVDFPGGGIRPALGMNLDQVWYNDGLGNNRSVYDWMSTTTGTHYITRGYEFHSLEVNFLGNTNAWGTVPLGLGGDCNGCSPSGGCGCGPRRWQFGWLAGFRYFQFNEAMLLRTDYNDTSIYGTNDFDELAYSIDTNNTLLGFQLGGQGSWYINNCLSLYGGGRFGVFNNRVDSSQYIAGDGGDAYINAGAYAGELYRYSAEDDFLAGVGQLDLGLRYNLGCHWSLTGGYRVVGISGVATAPDQIADNFADPRYVQNICADDSVVLHGAYLGAQFAW